jgi:hypothetical protein
MKDTWYWKNRDKVRAKAKARYKANPEPVRIRAKKWALAHPEQVKATRHAYKSARRRELAAKQLAYYFKNHEFHLKMHARLRAKKRLKTRAWARWKSAELTDQYIREQLAKYSPLSMQDFPQELVEVKRIQLAAKRLVKHKQIHLHQ